MSGDSVEFVSFDYTEQLIEINNNLSDINTTTSNILGLVVVISIIMLVKSFTSMIFKN